MNVDDHLVQGADSTIRRSDKTGESAHYLTYNLGTRAEATKAPVDELGELPETTAPSETFVLPVHLPKNVTNVVMHGPGHFKKPGGKDVYGVQITFTEPGKDHKHSCTIELPRPVVDVQLLNREPDEAYRSVA